MTIYIWYGAVALSAALTLLALFFFVFTRGTLLVRAWVGSQGAGVHVYPLYSEPWLMRLVDHQPIIAGILLFQYRRMVTRIGQGLQQTDLQGKTVLVTSCAFGNVVPRIVHAASQARAEKVLITDLLRNELTHVRSKLAGTAQRVVYLENDATRSSLADGSVSANILFFLLHELPHPMKESALDEAARVLAPGGSLYIAEFHRPRVWLMRVFGYLYFKVFEPYGLGLWDREDPCRYLRSKGDWTFRRSTYLFGNYQVLVATKQGD